MNPDELAFGRSYHAENVIPKPGEKEGYVKTGLTKLGKLIERTVLGVCPAFGKGRPK